LNIITTDEQIIIAQCTPSGTGAIALLRISGPGSFELAQEMGRLATGQLITQAPSHTIHLGWILDEQGTPIDQVMFLAMRAPRTYTGQDVIEITCHNNPFIIEHIIDRALFYGARIAQGGEFTRRAVLNNKIDLAQAEAVNELIHATTQMALKKSLSQLQGTLSAWFVILEEQLTKALALSEASFEFIDEEMEFGSIIVQIITELKMSLAQLKKSFDKQQHIRQGIRIALLGSVNAGKSSLFNALLGSTRAIVTNIAGTTRDTIEAGLNKQGNYWTLVDTAGLRQTDDIIEQEGIKRSGQEAHKADIIILVIDASRVMSAQEEYLYQELYKQYQHKMVIVYNKTDSALSLLPLESLKDGALHLSATEQQGIDQLELVLKEKIEQLFATIDSPFLLTKRQYNVLLSLEQKLSQLQEKLQPPISYELLSLHLQDALIEIAELTGKSISEAAMDKVFQEFCVGK